MNKSSQSNNLNEVLNKRTSYQKNTWSSLTQEMTIREVLFEIKSEKYKSQVLNLRELLQNNKKEEYSFHKKTLPAVTFCGTFEGERKKSKIQSYNSLIILDIDKLEEQEFKRIKECLIHEPLVFSFWESPSKEGLKGLVSLKYNFVLNDENLDLAHKGAFKKLALFFKEKYYIELDNSGNDITRLCFFSYDPSIVIKEDLVELELFELDILPRDTISRKTKIHEVKFASNRDALYNPANRNDPGDRNIVAAIIKFLEKKKLSITNSYDEWYKVAMAIANSFTYEIGEKYFLKLSAFDPEKYNEVNCKNFLLNCYETRNGALKFNTIVYFANEKGYITKKQKVRGSEAVDTSLSQVSSSKTVVYLPEELKK